MGEWSGFFPSHNGDRKYTTADTAATTDILFHSGVCQQGDLTLTPAGGMTAQLGEGWAIVNGYHYKNDGPLVLTFGYADGALDRIDTVVVRRDVNTRIFTQWSWLVRLPLRRLPPLTFVTPKHTICACTMSAFLPVLPRSPPA